jgi:hypothetical protein
VKKSAGAKAARELIPAALRTLAFECKDAKDAQTWRNTARRSTGPFGGDHQRVACDPGSDCAISSLDAQLRGTEDIKARLETEVDMWHRRDAE